MKISTPPAKKIVQGKALLEALRSIRFLLSRENEVRFMIAKPTLSEFKRQSLPAHLRTSVKKRTGPRVIVRKPRGALIPPVSRAHWPKDHMTENVQPSLVCVVQGIADLHINDYVVSCQTGDFVFYPGGIASANGNLPHLEGDVSGRRCSLLWIYQARINKKGLECYICHSSEHTHSSCDHSWYLNHLLAELFQGIRVETQKSDHDESIFYLLSTLLFLLQREINSGEAVFAPHYLLPESAGQTGDTAIQQACTYINANLHANLTIDFVARHVYLSPTIFTRLFKQQTGQTFNQYCTTARMKHAAILLKQSGMRVTEVSRSVGLTDCQFRVLAQRHWGCSPREFRLKNN